MRHKNFRRGLLSSASFLVACLALAPHGAQAADVINNGTLTLSGGGIDSDNISGTGKVIVTDPSGITLTGTNTYTGGTTIDAFHNVTLQIGNGGTSGSIVGDIVNPLFGFVVFNHSNTYTYAGNITGGGDGRQTGGGTLILTGKNQFGIHEFFTVDAGSTVQIGNGGTTGSLDAGGSAQGVIDNGKLVFNRSDYYEFFANITGTGVVEQLGSGTTYLSGDRLAWTGGTIVDNGVLIIRGALPSGPVTINGGTLQTTVPSGTGAVTVGPGGTYMISNDSGAVISNSGIVNFAPAVSNSFTGSINGTGKVTATGPGTENWNNATVNSTGITVSGGTLGLIGTTTYTGGITVANGGTLIVQSPTAYAASTITVQSGGTLQVGNSGPAGDISGDIAIAGSLVFKRADAYSYGGVISGTGSVVQANGNITTLTGNNTYTGTTSVQAGRLTLVGNNVSSTLNVSSGALLLVGSGGTTGSIMGNVADNGNLTFQRSDTYTYGGTVSGTGILQQAGTGTLILTGANTYTGGTTIAAGTLQIGSGGTSGSLTGNVANSGTLIFNRNDVVTYSGAVTGGTLINAGAGTLILSGNSLVASLGQTGAGTLDIEGTMNLSGSTTVVSTGQTFEGHGVVTNGTVSNVSGTVAPGASIGTLRVANYSQGSAGTLQIEVSPTASDLLQVDNTATLGGKLNISIAPGTYGNSSYTILTAANVTGNFASVTATPGYVFGVQYQPTQVNLVMTSTRPSQLFSDFAHDTLDTQERLSQQIFDHAMSRPCAVGGAGRTGCPEISVWFQGLAGAGSVDGNATANAYSTRWAGGLMGVDFVSDDGFWLGVSGSFARSALTVSANQGRVNTGIFSLGASGGASVFDGRVDASLLYISNTGDSSRAVVSGTVKQTAVAHPKNDAISFAAQYSQPILWDDLTGLARLNYVSIDQDAAVEGGAAPYDFSVRSHNYSSFYSDFALRLSHLYTLKSGATVLPEVSAGVRAVLSQPDLNFTGDPVELQGSGFAVPALDRDRAAFISGLGVSINKRGMSLFLRANGRISGNQRDGVVSVGAAFHF